RSGSGDVCDPDEKCTGTSADCPDDVMKPSTYACRAAAGECDLQETCPGAAGKPCPSDAKKPATTACTDDGKTCTLDQCDGTSPPCPPPPCTPGIRSRSGSGDVCDPDEKCTGTSADCPYDVMKPSTYVCRAAAGECDLDETCPGVAGKACPLDAQKTADTPCTADGEGCPLRQCDRTTATRPP